MQNRDYWPDAPEVSDIQLFVVSRYCLSVTLLQQMIQHLANLTDAEESISISGSADTLEIAERKVPNEFTGATLLVVNAMCTQTLFTIKRLLQARPQLKLIVITDKASGHYPKQCRELGVQGLLSREDSLPEVLKALREIARGRKYVSRAITVAEQVGKSSGNVLTQYWELSNREQEIMDAVAQGQSIQSIARDLLLSPKTISTYRYRIFDKLMVDNDVQLTRLAAKAGLVSLEG